MTVCLNGQALRNASACSRLFSTTDFETCIQYGVSHSVRCRAIYWDLPMNHNTFGAASTLRVADVDYRIFSLTALEKKGIANIARMPVSHRILLENLLRCEDGRKVHASDIEAVAKGQTGETAKEIQFMPARVLLQDFTGVPCVVDLAAMRDALQAMGADPSKANPLMPADLVIDHSVQVDKFGSRD